MNYFNHQNVQLAYEAVYNQDLCESMEDLGLIDDYDYLDEGYKKLPVGKMLRKSLTKLSKGVRKSYSAAKQGSETTGGQIDIQKAGKHFNKYGKILQTIGTHDPEVAKAKEASNSNVKGRKRLSRLIRIDTNRRTLPVRRMRAQVERLLDRGMETGNRDLMNRAEFIDAVRQSRANRHQLGYKNPNRDEYREEYEAILEYLIQEGYADTLGSAEIILENMSEDWIEEILSEAEYMGDTRESSRRVQQAAHKKAKKLKNEREEVKRIFGDQVPKGEKEKTLSGLAFLAGLRAQIH